MLSEPTLRNQPDAATKTIAFARHGCRLSVVLLIALLCSPRAEASQSFAMTAPNTGFAGPSGLLVDLSSNWAGGPGYVPFDITVRCVPPSPRERTLRIGVTVRSWYRRRHEFTGWTEVLVPLNATTVTSKLSLPKLFPWQQLQLTVLENGRQLRDLDAASGGSMYVGFNNLQEGPSILFVEDLSGVNATPDISTLIGLFPNSQAVQNAARVVSSSTLTVNVASHPMMHVLPAKDAPTEWLHYTSLDVVCLSMAQVHKMMAVNPAAWKAICTWLAAGGNLCVYEIGDDNAGLTKLERALQIPPGTGAGAAAKDRWNAPSVALSRTLDIPTADYQTAPLEQPSGSPTTQSATIAAQGPAPFLWRDVGLGRAIAIRSAKPLPGTATDWTWVLNSISRERWHWSQRHGLQLDSGNSDFWNFLVPGVGLPPIGAFRFLITAFVVLIGPVNYFMLKRWKRLHLLLFVVPAGAAVITAALLLYAMFSDGFGTRLRTRTFTDIDQRRGHAATWSRLSYYAGLSPAGGLTFQNDTAILPLNFEAEADYNASPRAREFEWAADQRLTQGWLPSRTPTQLITVRSRSSKAGLKIVESGNRIRVDNHLGTRIRHLLVAGSEGKLFYAASLQPNDSVRLDAIAGTDDTINPEIDRMLLVFKAHTPATPEGIDLSQMQYTVAGSWRFVNGAATQSTSRLERAIGEAKSAVAGRSLAPRSYIAIVDRSPEADYGMSGGDEQAGFHLVRGNW